MAVPRPKNGTTAGFIMLPESSDNGVSEETIETVPKKQRRMAERRKAPIVAKHETRNRKINLTSFKQKYLTLKRKVSAFMCLYGLQNCMCVQFLATGSAHVQEVAFGGKSWSIEVKDLVFGGCFDTFHWTYLDLVFESRTCHFLSEHSVCMFTEVTQVFRVAWAKKKKFGFGLRSSQGSFV